MTSAFDKAWSFTKMTRFAPSEEAFNLHGETERLHQLADLLRDDPAINMRPRDEVGMEKVGPLGGKYDVGNRWSRIITDRSLSPETLKRLRALYGTAYGRRLDEEKDSPTRGAMQYLFAPKRRAGEGKTGSPLDRFNRPKGSVSHTVPERTEITPEHRERMLNTPQTEEEERAMDLFDTSLESGGISRGYYPIWEKMRIAGDIDFAKNIFDVIHHWNPKWGRPPDLHPNASDEEVQEYLAAAAKLKQDWMDEHGYMPEMPNLREIVEQETKLSTDWNRLIQEHGFLPSSHKHSTHPNAERDKKIREEMGHHPHNWGSAEKTLRFRMRDAGIPHWNIRPIRPHVAEKLHKEKTVKWWATDEGQQYLREKLFSVGDLSKTEWLHLQEHPELEPLGMGPGDLPDEIKQNLPVLQPQRTLEPDWEKTYGGIPENPGDIPRALGVMPQLNPNDPAQIGDIASLLGDMQKKGTPMDLAWRLLKQNLTAVYLT